MPDLLSELTQRQVRVIGVPGWDTHSRPYPFKPIGVMLHDTGDKRSLERLRNGTKWIPGPLANFLVSKSGNVYLISSGYTNHAGKGVSKVLNRTRNNTAPEGNATRKGDLHGDRFYYGVHVEHSGGVDYPAIQIHAVVALCAALCEMHEWSHNRVIQHKEWSSRNNDMEYHRDIRARVEDVMCGRAPRNYFLDCTSNVFQEGDEGECVRILQSHLLRHAAHVDPTGLYDEYTVDAVKKFQTDNHITVDGIVGPQTWRFLEEPVQQEQVELAGAYPILREGVISEFVNTVRILLNRIGYSVEEDNRTFGTVLHDAVWAFQKDNDLTVDGVVGPETWSTLSSRAEHFASPMVCEQRTFTNGDKDYCIEHLKEELVAKGFKIPITDEYDSVTEATVRRFQRIFGVAADGVVGPETWRALEKDYDVPKAVIYTGNFSKGLANMMSLHYKIPALSYLDKRSVREAILIHDATKHADRYLETRRVRGVNHAATAKLVYNELLKGDEASV